MELPGAELWVDRATEPLNDAVGLMEETRKRGRKSPVFQHLGTLTDCIPDEVGTPRQAGSDASRALISAASCWAPTSSNAKGAHPQLDHPVYRCRCLACSLPPLWPPTTIGTISITTGRPGALRAANGNLACETAVAGFGSAGIIGRGGADAAQRRTTFEV